MPDLTFMASFSHLADPHSGLGHTKKGRTDFKMQTNCTHTCVYGVQSSLTFAAQAATSHGTCDHDYVKVTAGRLEHCRKDDAPDLVVQGDIVNRQRDIAGCGCVKGLCTCA